MNNATLAKVAAGVVIVVAIGLIAANMGGLFVQPFRDGGVDVNNTACPDIATARRAIAVELDSRKQSADDSLKTTRDKISDDYFAHNHQLDLDYHSCISAALTADPCKEPFERVGTLYEEIMADFAADKGFNQAKFDERERAKKEYNDCVEATHKPDFYDNMKAKCDADLAAGQEANSATRQSAEAGAQANYQAAIETAQKAWETKSATLDAIEKKCNEPGGKANVNVGGLTTGGTGTKIQATHAACTGLFSGNDPELQKEIANLEHQLQKAKAAGQTDGLYGTNRLQSSLDELRQQLQATARSCSTDADCGDTTPVCCSGTEVGQVFCDGGTCAAKKTECQDPEFCAGKPAMCVGAATGTQQQDGISISRTISEEGACSQNLQTLSLQQASADSVRYSFGGSIPDWLHIDKPSGTLPASVNVTYDCNTVQGFGPGTYTVNGSVTVYNTNNELINTIPFKVAITVEPVARPQVDVIEYNGKYIPISELHRFTGPECDKEEHWHANQGAAKALDGSTVPEGDHECGYGKTKDRRVIQVPDIRVGIEVNMGGL